MRWCPTHNRVCQNERCKCSARTGSVHVGLDASLVRKANDAVRAVAPQLNDAQRQLALAIGAFETGFGVSGSWLFSDGTPSYNWGGLVGSGTAGSLSHGDRTPTGEPTTYGFMAFNNMQEGFAAFMRTWARADTIAASAAGDALGVARAMCTHAYFGGVTGTAEDRAQAYAKGIHGTAQTIASQLGEASAMNWDGSRSAPLVGNRCDSTVSRASGSQKTPFVLAALLSAAVGFGIYWITGKK